MAVLGNISFAKNFSEASAEKNLNNGRFNVELPNDSGEKIFSSALPDDSGEFVHSKSSEETKGSFEIPSEFSNPNNLGKDLNKSHSENVNEKYYLTDTKAGLTEEQKSLIIKETGWSSEVVNCIENMNQYEVYKNADLHEAEIDGRKCLVKDIDMDYVDSKTGLTNRELMAKGRAPIDSRTGEPIELHHMGQDFKSPFAELCANSEHGDGNDAILHDKKVESWRQDPEKKNQYNNVQRPNHWKTRAQEE